MLKKLILSTLGVGLVAGVTLGRDAASYFSTAWGRTTSAVRDSVPIDFQIDRAKRMVTELAPEVRHAMEVIAREEIALESLTERIDAAETRAREGKRDILRMQSDLETGAARFTYAGHSYSRDQVEEDLSRRFTRHKLGDETLGHLREMHDARRKNLDAARQKLAAMISAQKSLETELVNLEAKRQLVAVAQASTDVQLDDSRLARARGLIADIRSRLEVASRLALTDTAPAGEIALDGPAQGDVSRQVAEYFGLDSAAPAVAKEKASAEAAPRGEVAMRK